MLGGNSRAIPFGTSLDDLFFIGCIHGNLGAYKKLIADIESQRPGARSIQLGDFGIGAEDLNGIDPERHRFIRGNHDDPGEVRRHGHFLGDYGLLSAGSDLVAFVGGAVPSPGDLRRGETWSPELDNAELNRAFSLFGAAGPDIALMLSHDFAPGGKYVPAEQWGPTREMFWKLGRTVAPRIWVNGHGHTASYSIESRMSGTRIKFQVGMNQAASYRDVSTREACDRTFERLRLERAPG